MINPIETARARSKQFRENATKVQLRLTEERKQLQDLRASTTARNDPGVRALERVVELDQILTMQLDRMASDYEEIVRQTR